MSDKVFVGRRCATVSKPPALEPISKIVLWVDSENCYEAGDDSGREFEITCPYGSQKMANDLLGKLGGYSYRPLYATDALIDPAAELGDAVTVAGRQTVLASMSMNFDGLLTSDIAAPGAAELKTENNFTNAEKLLNRKIARTNSLISKTTGQIRLEIQGVEENLTYLELDLEGIEGRVKDAEGNIGALELTATQLQAEISGKIDGEDAQALIDLSLQELELSISNNKGSTTFTLKGGGAELTSETFDIHVKNVNIEGRLNAEQLNLTGAITFGDLDEDTQLVISDAYTMAAENQLPGYIQKTYIDSVSIRSPTIVGGTFIGNEFNVLSESSGGSFNLYGKFWDANLHILSISYSAGDYPSVYFSSPNGATANWAFGNTYVGGNMSFGVNDINFNIGGSFVSFRGLEARVTALENK